MEITPGAGPALQRTSAWRQAGLGAFWLGTSFVITPVYTLLLQFQVGREVTERNQGGAIGLATGLGGVVAMLIPPLVGHYSDRLKTPWGRRRPVILVGAAGTAVALVAMRYAHTYPATLASFVAIVSLLNMAGAAYVALIPDTVEKEGSGRASGIWGSFFLVGSAGSAVLISLLARSRSLTWAYFILAGVLVTCLVITLWTLRHDGPARGDAPRPPAPPFHLGVFLSPLWTGDFGWAFLTRLLIVGGTYAVLPFLLLTFRHLENIRGSLQFTALFEAIVLGTAVPVAIVCGTLSDSRGRKPFVYLSGALAFIVLGAIAALSPLPQPALLVLGALYGVSFGAFSAVDWALALDTLPDRENPAKDLGLFHVADALPRVAVPFLAGSLLDVFNTVAPRGGYRVLFVVAILLYALGTLFVSRIRSVR